MKYVQSIAQSLLMELPTHPLKELKSLGGTEGAMKTLEKMYQESYYRGKIEGKLESAILMLENGDEMKKVARVLRLSVEDIQKELERRGIKEPQQLN